MKAYLLLLFAFFVPGCADNSKTMPVSQAAPTSTEFQRAETLFYANTKQDSAFYYFTNITETSKDSLLVAMAYTYMAMIQEDGGDFFGCQASALEGLKHVDEKEPKYHYCLSSLYNELGASNAGLKNYDAAVDYYDLAIKYQQDEDYKAIFMNNKAVAYRDKGDYQKAINILKPILESQKKNKLEYARILTNLASIQWLADSRFQPIPQLRYALNIRLVEKDNNGMAASYAHFSDYYRIHDTDSALVYAHKMYDLAHQINSADKKLDALRKLASLAPSSESKAYFTRYTLLDDSIQLARTQAKNQYALIRYRSEKTKAENLVLQQRNMESQLKILKQRIWIVCIILLAVAFTIWILFWLRKKKQKLEWKSKEEIQEHQLKTSQKVHDVVANGLYRIMTEIDHNGFGDKEAVLGKIEELYERSRDISYEPAATDSMNDQIIEIITSFATSQTSVSIAGDLKKIWPSVSQTAKTELEQVLQELLVNMSKHSKAHHVVVRFSLENQQLEISYRDDGVGFPPDFTFGNGLQSTETRIGKIKGKLIFTKESTPGASIKIIVPIHNA